MSPSKTGDDSDGAAITSREPTVSASEPVAPNPAHSENLGGQSTQWRETVSGLLLVRAEAVVAAQHPTPPAPRLSIAVMAKALTDIDLLLAGCCDIDLADLGTAKCRSHAMRVQRIPLSVLSGVPVIEVQASGMTEPARLCLTVHLHLQDGRTSTDSLITHELSDVTLTPQNPVARFDLPLDTVTPNDTAARVV